MWYVPAMDIRRKEILPHATMCMNLQDIMASEMSQTQKNNII
jgi:RNA polymerase-binding transcription factor DksA